MGTIDLLRRFLLLVASPFFLSLTLIWHLCIGVGAYLFLYFEKGQNPQVNSAWDSLYWVLATVTTTGYGDITPITFEGRILAIIMMILGVIFVWSYTALIAGSLISPHLSRVEAEFKELESSVEKFEKELRYDEGRIEDLIDRLERLERLKNSRKPQ